MQSAIAAVADAAGFGLREQLVVIVQPDRPRPQRPGHAMRASDPERAFGSVIGKALGGFSPANGEETGLVLVLVSLQ